MLDITRRELYENRVEIERQLTRPIPCVLGNRVELQQVILNLIINGIEAMAAVTNRRHLLWVQSGVDESGNISIAVRDSGRGIGLDADHMFTPFYTTKANGLGMGLSISRSRMKLMGGDSGLRPIILTAPHFTLRCQ